MVATVIDITPIFRQSPYKIVLKSRDSEAQTISFVQDGQLYCYQSIEMSAKNLFIGFIQRLARSQQLALCWLHRHASLITVKSTQQCLQFNNS